MLVKILVSPNSCFYFHDKIRAHFCSAQGTADLEFQGETGEQDCGYESTAPLRQLPPLQLSQGKRLL